MKTYTPEQIAKMKDDLDALDGKGRHNVGSNIVRGDGIYANSLERRYEMTIEDMRKLVKANRKPKAAPKKAEAVTIDRIEIHEFISGKPNGDRATHMTPCSHFKVFVFNPKKPEPFMAFDYNCYEAFHSHVEKRERGLKAATEYAENLAMAIGWGGEVKLRQFQAKIVSHTEWQEVA